jgi:hypothetical protein
MRAVRSLTAGAPVPDPSGVRNAAVVVGAGGGGGGGGGAGNGDEDRAAGDPARLASGDDAWSDQSARATSAVAAAAGVKPAVLASLGLVSTT